MDVIRGALAVAGSIFSLVNRKGRIIPIMLPTITTSVMVITRIRIISGARTAATKLTPAAIVRPKSNETVNSFPNSFIQSLV